MVIEYLLDKPSQILLSQELTPPKEIKSAKDFWEVKHIADNPNFNLLPAQIEQEQQKSKSKSKKEKEELKHEQSKAGGPKSLHRSSNFPYICETSGLEMNGQYKFVFGLDSKALVSEQALREVNAGLFPNSALNKSTELTSGCLHPIYEESKEKLLVCPITNEKFGYPLLLYPSTPAELKRSEQFIEKLSMKKKMKKAKKHKSENSAEIAPRKKIKS